MRTSNFLKTEFTYYFMRQLLKEILSHTRLKQNTFFNQVYRCNWQ